VSTNETCKDFEEVMKMVMNSSGEFDYVDWSTRSDVKFFYSIVFFSIFVFGLIGNGLLISILLRGRSTVANLFLINLAISDLLLCITSVPISPIQAFYKQWFFGLFLCKAVPFSQALSVLVSTYCLCFIALDRYTSIVTPMNEPWSIRKAQCLMLLTWIIAASFSSPLYITQKTKIFYATPVEKICGEFCGEYEWPEDDNMSKMTFGFLLFIFQSLIPAVIITFSYWQILQKVRIDWIVEEGSMLTAAQQAQTAVRKRRVMYVLILMVVVFMLSWLPLTVSMLLRDLDIVSHPQVYFHFLSVTAIAMSSVVWNPLLYFWLSKRHRRALRDDMFWLTNAKRQPTGLLSRFAPSPNVSVVYRRTLERHLGAHHFRRGTLADPTNMMRESALNSAMQPNCFLLVPLMPLCQTIRRNSTLTPSSGHSLLPPRMDRQRRLSSTVTDETRV
ncbi:hypothetical protein PFISCL1PPCAC_2402, partial [Pristionchus fissidentatus]